MNGLSTAGFVPEIGDRREYQIQVLRDVGLEWSRIAAIMGLTAEACRDILRRRWAQKISEMDDRSHWVAALLLMKELDEALRPWSLGWPMPADAVRPDHKAVALAIKVGELHIQAFKAKSASAQGAAATEMGVARARSDVDEASAEERLANISELRRLLKEYGLDGPPPRPRDWPNRADSS
jgi:hypothetical protein